MQNNVWTLVQWTQIWLFDLVSFLFEMIVWGMQEQGIGQNTFKHSLA